MESLIISPQKAPREEEEELEMRAVVLMKRTDALKALWKFSHLACHIIIWPFSGMNLSLIISLTSQPVMMDLQCDTSSLAAEQWVTLRQRSAVHWQNNKGGGCCCDRNPGLHCLSTLALEVHHSVDGSSRRLQQQREDQSCQSGGTSAFYFSLPGATANKSCVSCALTSGQL